MVIQQLGLLLSKDIQRRGAKPRTPTPRRPKKKPVVIQPSKRTCDDEAEERRQKKKRKRDVGQYVDEHGVTQTQQLWTLNVVKNEEDDPEVISSEDELVLLDPTTSQMKFEQDEGAGPSRPDTSQPAPGLAQDVKQERGDDYPHGPEEEELTEEKPAWVPPEFYTQRQPHPIKYTKRVKEEFAKIVAANPWPSDNENLTDVRELAPKAGITKVKGSKHKARPCWLRLRRKWLLRKFLDHLIGECNIRFKRATYSSICHHQSTAWDTHPLCWQCYIEMGLPLCGLDPEIECPHCEIMGVKARKARADKLRMGRDLAKAGRWEELRNYSQKTGLPGNVYTQADADEWHRAKNLIDMPNPDWLIKGQPVGSCFPSNLVKRGQSIAQAIEANPGWKTGNYSHEVARHNSDKTREIEDDPTTPSDLRSIYVPRCLVWGIKTESERDEQLKQVNQAAQQVAKDIASTSESTAAALDSHTGLLTALSKRLITLLEKPQDSEVAAFQGLMDYVVNDDIDAAAQGVPGVPEGTVVTPGTIKEMSNEQLQTLVKNLSGKLQEQKEATSKVEQQLTEAQQRRVDREKMFSPSEQRQNMLPPILVSFQEKGLQLADWDTEDYPTMNPGLVQRSPRNCTMTELLDKMRTLDINDADWTSHEDLNDAGEQVVHVVPKLEPRFLQHHWEVLCDLQDREPFNLQVGFPTDVGLIHGVEPHFKFEEVYFNPDEDGHFPTGNDGLLLRYAEAEQLTRLTAAIGAFNNIVAVATRILSLRLEDLATPLGVDREAERLLTSTIREASDSVNKLTVRANALSEAVVRRDSMLRGGMDPTSHPAAFASPFLRDVNYTPYMGLY